jgi:hypothetical protein
VSLSQVTATDWISHLGHPLCVHFSSLFVESSLLPALSRFGVYHNQLGDDKELLDFVKQKCKAPEGLEGST